MQETHEAEMTNPSGDGALPAESDDEPAADDGALLESDDSDDLAPEELAADEPEPTLAVPEDQQAGRLGARR